MTAELADALDVLADALAERIARRLLAGARPGMVDQAVSPLGKRRHCAAVRARMQRGESGAAIVGRRYLLSTEALTEELGRQSSRPRAAAAAGVREELERELRLVGGRR